MKTLFRKVKTITKLRRVRGASKNQDLHRHLLWKADPVTNPQRYNQIFEINRQLCAILLNWILIGPRRFSHSNHLKN